MRGYYGAGAFWGGDCGCLGDRHSEPQHSCRDVGGAHVGLSGGHSAWTHGGAVGQNQCDHRTSHGLSAATIHPATRLYDRRQTWPEKSPTCTVMQLLAYILMHLHDVWGG